MIHILEVEITFHNRDGQNQNSRDCETGGCSLYRERSTTPHRVFKIAQERQKEVPEEQTGILTKYNNSLGKLFLIVSATAADVSNRA